MVSRCHHMHIESGVHPPSHETSYVGKVAGGWKQYIPPKRRWLQDNTVLHPEDINLHSERCVNLNSCIICCWVYRMLRISFHGCVLFNNAGS